MIISGLFGKGANLVVGRYRSGLAVRRLFSNGEFKISDGIRAKFAPHDYERYEKEQLIVVNDKNEEVGQTNIVFAHLTENVEKNHTPHRAFSVLIFDKEFNMLLQKRAKTKPIFPGFWANSCCSHPLKNYVGEDEVEGASGVIKAAVRRVKQELGIEIDPKSLKLQCIFLYFAKYNETFSECEMDHVLAVQIPGIMPDIPFKTEEVEQLKWVSLKNFAHELEKIKQSGEKIAPWFEYIRQLGIEDWWKSHIASRSVQWIYKTQKPIVLPEFYPSSHHK